MTKSLRDTTKSPGENYDEKAHISRIAEEMRKLGFARVEIGPMGNVLSYTGTDKTLIGFDTYIDTVGIGSKNNWNLDPYEGYGNEAEIGGRNVSGQYSGIVNTVYGAKIMKDLGLLSDKCAILVASTVQGEDCNSFCWQYIINEGRVCPDFVVSTEPTGSGTYHDQRGCMKIHVDVKDVSCHGSTPEHDDNAIYKMADILQDAHTLSENDAADGKGVKDLVKMLDEKFNSEREGAGFLECGTVIVSKIFFTSLSRCAVTDSCVVSLDRRMITGEAWGGYLGEIRVPPTVQRYDDDVTISMYEYSRPSYKGPVCPIGRYFPTWVVLEDHDVTKVLEDTYESLFDNGRIDIPTTGEMRKIRPLTDRWILSIDDTSVMERNGIPCIDFRPDAETQAHAPSEAT